MWDFPHPGWHASWCDHWWGFVEATILERFHIVQIPCVYIWKQNHAYKVFIAYTWHKSRSKQRELTGTGSAEQTEDKKQRENISNVKYILTKMSLCISLLRTCINKYTQWRKISDKILVLVKSFIASKKLKKLY